MCRQHDNSTSVWLNLPADEIQHRKVLLSPGNPAALSDGFGFRSVALRPTLSVWFAFFRRMNSVSYIGKDPESFRAKTKGDFILPERFPSPPFP